MNTDQNATPNFTNKNFSIEFISSYIQAWFSTIGSFSIFIQQIFIRTFYPCISLRLTFQQMEFVGNKSILIIVLSAILIGAIFGLQLGSIFRVFGAEAMIGAASGVALARELAPVFGAFLVTGRAGSAMAAEIGSMRVNEQIDALRVMAINPINYLVAPRVWASVIMMPILCTVFIAVGMFASLLVAKSFYNVDAAIFFDKIAWICKPDDLWIGLKKSVAFGFIFSVVGCYKGFHTQGGAEGVGKATTQAVVISLVLILLGDFLLSYMFYDPNDKLIK